MVESDGEFVQLEQVQEDCHETWNVPWMMGRDCNGHIGMRCSTTVSGKALFKFLREMTVLREHISWRHRCGQARHISTAACEASDHMAKMCTLQMPSVTTRLRRQTKVEAIQRKREAAQASQLPKRLRIDRMRGPCQWFPVASVF